MKYLNNLKISQKLFVAFSIIVVLYSISLIFTALNLNYARHDIESIYEVRLKSIDYLIEADRDAYQSSIAISQCLNTKVNTDNAYFQEKRTEILENMKQVEERYLIFDSLNENITTEKHDKLDSIFHEEYKKWSIVTTEIDSLLKIKNLNKAEELYFGTYMNHFEPMRGSMDSFTEISLKDAEDEYISSKNKLTNVFLYSFIIFGVVLSIIILSAYLIISSIKKPIDRAIAISHKISKGFLAVDIQNTGKDEMSRVLNSLKNMVKELSKIVGEIIDSSYSVKSASDQISISANQMSQGASEQASAAEEISSSMEQIVANINQNTVNSRETETIAQKTASNIILVNQSVNHTINAMKNIVEKISIITEIANKTDLLSVNAAIEASKAGDFGRGFAVVSNEIKNLAERSQNAAKEINSLSVSSVSIAEESGKQLSEIIPDIQRTASLVSEITAASIEQLEGSEQINNALAQLSQVTQQNAATAEELSANSSMLIDQAGKLTKTVAFFTMNDKDDVENTINSMSSQIENLQDAIKQLRNRNQVLKETDEIAEQAEIEQMNNSQPQYKGFKLNMKPDELDNDFEKDKFPAK